MPWKSITYRPLLSLATTHVDRPQNGVNSHDLPGSKVAHLVDAKHMPGKSIREISRKKEEKEIRRSQQVQSNHFISFHFIIMANWMQKMCAHFTIDAFFSRIDSNVNHKMLHDVKYISFDLTRFDRILFTYALYASCTTKTRLMR